MRYRKTTRHTKLGQPGIRKENWGGSSWWLQQACGWQTKLSASSVSSATTLKPRGMLSHRPLSDAEALKQEIRKITIKEIPRPKPLIHLTLFAFASQASGFLMLIIDQSRR